jgi:hypothetical protein
MAACRIDKATREQVEVGRGSLAIIVAKTDGHRFVELNDHECKRNERVRQRVEGRKGVIQAEKENKGAGKRTRNNNTVHQKPKIRPASGHEEV